MIRNKSIDKSKIRTILIRATNWVGDLAISLPALEALRENFPSSEITVLARPWVIPLIEHHPSVDRIITLERGKGFLSRTGQFLRMARILRREEFDMAILFQNAFEAALLAYMGGVKLRIGYHVDGRGFLLTHAIKRNKGVLKLHQVEYYLSILRSMGWDAKTRIPVLYIGKRDLESVNSLLSAEGLKTNDEVIGLSPGAMYGPAKRWPPERFAAVGDLAVERWGSKVILFSPGEQRICESLASMMNHTPLNLCGRTTLGQAMAAIKRCHFFITNDSGLMHVAAALDVPVLAIFGSTDQEATGPLGKRARTIQKKVDCAPCLKKRCPSDFRCMLDITPEDVWKELEGMKEAVG